MTIGLLSLLIWLPIIGGAAVLLLTLVTVIHLLMGDREVSTRHAY